MPTGISERRIDFSFEELGTAGIHVFFEVTGKFYPGDRKIEYYPDGSGYPGSPDDFEIQEIHTKTAWGETWSFNREDRPDWFDFLDKCIHNKILDNLDKYGQDCLERIDDGY